MNLFRIVLAAYLVAVLVYTGLVALNHGPNLFPVFFGDLAALTWAGQFNLDFMGFLMLSAIWLSWRHHFSPGGLLLGLVGFFGGIVLLAPYLIYASYKANGDIAELLLGRARVQALANND